MIVTAWNDGKHNEKGNGYGFEISDINRDRLFKKTWEDVVLQLETPYRVVKINIKDQSFWSGSFCVLVDKDIGKWFLLNGYAPWKEGKAPKFYIEPIFDNIFIIRPTDNAEGAFNPFLFNVRLDADIKRLYDNEAYRNKIGLKLWHEYVHFLQSVGTTYGLMVFYEVMDYIAIFLKEAKGAHQLIFCGLSHISLQTTPDELNKHLLYHYNTLEGYYGSRPFPFSFEGYTHVGGSWLNEDTCCYEYFRWNEVDREYFSTPIGAYCLRECLSYIMEQFKTAAAESSEQIVIRLWASAESYSFQHYYTAPLEMFVRTYGKQNINYLATLIALMDLSLQIPSTSYMDHPDWKIMTIPSWRFERFFQAVNEIKWLDNSDDSDYCRFVDEVTNYEKKWPSIRETVRDFLDLLTEQVKNYNDMAQKHIELDRASFDQWVNGRVRICRELTSKQSGYDPSSEDLKQQEENYAKALRSDPLWYCDTLGLGIAKYIIKAFNIRLEHPLYLAFPQRYSHILEDILPLPEFSIMDSVYRETSTSSDTLLFCKDIGELRHLWALTLQWTRGKKTSLICGNRYFGLPCNNQHDQEQHCCTWSPGVNMPKTQCDFTNILQHYQLVRV